MDFVIHGLVLASPYALTPKLWRPMQEMNMELMYATVLVAAAAFVGIYAWFIADKSVRTAVRYGLVFGIGSGVSMGCGSYSVMPLPYEIALGWCLGAIIEAVAAGWITGLIVKKQGGAEAEQDMRGCIPV
jgi:CDP-diglyceride synthetase